MEDTFLWGQWELPPGATEMEGDGRETWTFRKISWNHPGPSDSQRQSSPKVFYALWVMSSCICSFT